MICLKLLQLLLLPFDIHLARSLFKSPVSLYSPTLRRIPEPAFAAAYGVLRTCDSRRQKINRSDTKIVGHGRLKSQGLKKRTFCATTMSSSVGGTMFGPGFESKLLFLEQFRKYSTSSAGESWDFCNLRLKQINSKLLQDSSLFSVQTSSLQGQNSKIFLCPFGAYYLRYGVRQLFTISGISQKSGTYVMLRKSLFIPLQRFYTVLFISLF